MTNLTFLPWYLFKEHAALDPGGYYYVRETDDDFTIDPYYLGGCV